VVVVLSVVVIARSEQDRHSQLLDGRAGIAGGTAQEEVPEEADIAQASAVVVAFVLVVDEVTGGHDEIEVALVVESVRVLDDVAELVVHVEKAFIGLLVPGAGEGGGKAVDPAGHVQVGDVRDPEGVPDPPVVDRVGGHGHPVVGATDGDIVEATFLDGGKEWDDPVVSIGQRVCEKGRDDPGGVAVVPERDPPLEGPSDSGGVRLGPRHADRARQHGRWIARGRRREMRPSESRPGEAGDDFGIGAQEATRAQGGRSDGQVDGVESVHVRSYGKCALLSDQWCGCPMDSGLRSRQIWVRESAGEGLVEGPHRANGQAAGDDGQSDAAERGDPKDAVPGLCVAHLLVLSVMADPLGADQVTA
jgi:hypothetical protein